MSDEEDNLDWEEWNPSKTSFAQHMVAGSLAGLAEHVTIFPIDSIKTHIQCSRCGSISPFQTWNSIIKSEGFFRLWRGVSAMFIGCIPAHAAYFSIFEAMKVFTGADQKGHHPFQAAVCGAFATTSHDLLITPFDTIKQRMQLGHYNNLRHCIKSIITQEGVLTFYRSFPTTVLMNIPYGCVMVSMNESIKKILNPSANHNIYTSIIAGSISGAIAAFVTNPMDVLKTRLQTQDLEPCKRSGKAGGTGGGVPVAGVQVANITKGLNSVVCQTKATPSASSHSKGVGNFSALRTIWRNEGVRGLFRGVVPRMLIHAPSVAISWTTYETIKEVLVKNGRMSV